MLQLIIWLGALLCTNPNHTPQNHGTCNLIHLGSGGVTTQDDGGETGGLPHPPPPPPPPPTGN